MTIVTPQPTLTPENQRFVVPGRHSWEQFKTIQAVMGQSNLRITYIDGVIEFMTVGEYHESIKSMIAILLGIYFWQQGIEFIPVGSATRESEEKSVSFEPDESYYLGEKKDHPDLAIEVNITSGSPKKSEKYQRFGIQEVWMWENNQFLIFSLENDSYIQVQQSKLLPHLNFSVLEECVVMPSRLEAIQKFTAAAQ